MIIKAVAREFALLIVGPQRRLVVQNRAQQRIVNLDLPVVADEPQLAEFVHEETDT